METEDSQLQSSSSSQPLKGVYYLRTALALVAPLFRMPVGSVGTRGLARAPVVAELSLLTATCYPRYNSELFDVLYCCCVVGKLAPCFEHNPHSPMERLDEQAQAIREMSETTTVRR